MESVPDDSKLPLSPWAERFFPSMIPYSRVWDGFIHSGLAPEYPSIAPENIDAWKSPDKEYPRPGNDELDRLFCSEREQMETVGGLRSWQVAALNSVYDAANPDRELPSPPLDHTQEAWKRYWDSQVIVNEESWFFWFHRSRFLDRRVDGVSTIRDPFPDVRMHKNPWWTVDNAAMWRQLSPSIEMANRIMNMLIHMGNPWFYSLVLGVPYRWRHTNHLIAAAHENDTAIDPLMMPISPANSWTADQLRHRLGQLLSRVLWTFQDEDSADKPAACYAFATVMPARYLLRSTMGAESHVGLTPSVFIAIHAAYLRSLCSRRLTLPQRCNMQVQLAITLLHELMHAIWWSRNTELHGYAIDWAELPEPHMNGEVVNELGESFEAMLLGVMMKLAPVHPTIPVPGLYKPPQPEPDYVLCRAEPVVNVGFPFPNIGKAGKVAQLFPAVQVERDMARAVAFPIPGVFAASIRSEDWWREVVGTCGLRAFKIPRVLRSESRFPQHFHGRRAYNTRRVLGPQDMVGYWIHPMVEVLGRWEQRRSAWDRAQPWHHLEYTIWSQTPWSWTHARESIQKFRDAHARRDLAGSISSARELTSAQLPPDGSYGHPSTNPISWIFVAIGHLMLATVPLMEEDYNANWGRKSFVAYPNSLGSPLIPAPLHADGQGHAWGAVVELNGSQPLFNTKIREPKSDWSSPSLKMDDFVRMFHAHAKTHPIPSSWMDSVMQTAHEIAVSHTFISSLGAEATNSRWHDFNFKIPPYDPSPDKWVIAVEPPPTGEVSAVRRLPKLESHPASAPATYIGRFVSPPPSPGRMFFGTLPPWDGDFESLEYKQAAGERTPRPRGRARPTYFTVGEVGNRARSDKATWVVEPDGNWGFDVYDITGPCHELGLSTGEDIRSQLLEVGDDGPALRADGDPRADAIRAQLGSKVISHGKLIMRRRLEEIAEYDGTNGMPTWVRIGTGVYDLSDIRALRDERTKVAVARLKRGAGGCVDGLPTDTDQLDRLVQRLLPYRHAIVADHGHRRARPTLQVMTEAMLSRHDNPGTGCYTAVDGYVYDLGGYLDMHPGGSDILMRYLGREATEFKEWHELEVLDRYPDLRVGRIVPELSMDEVSVRHVVIHGWIFDVSSLAPEHSSRPEDHWMYTGTYQFRGGDASEAIRYPNTDMAAALRQLFVDGKEHIVGRLREDKELPSIPSGELKRHNDPESTRGAWTVVGELVYDVTSIMLYHQPFYEKDIPHIWAGMSLDDKELATWLSQNYPDRVIGKLVQGPAWEQPAKKTSLGNPNFPDLRESRAQPRRPPKKRDPVVVESIPEDILRWIGETQPSGQEVEDKLLEGIAAGTVKPLSRAKKAAAGLGGTEDLPASRRRGQSDEVPAEERQAKKARVISPEEAEAASLETPRRVLRSGAMR